MCSAQTTARSGGQPLTTRRRADAQAQARCRRGEGVITGHVGRSALVAAAAQRVAAHAQVVGPDRALVARDTTDQAGPVPRPGRPWRADRAEHVDIAGPAGVEPVPAAGAQTARIPRLQRAASDPADRIAEQRMLAVRGQRLRDRVPTDADQQRIIDRRGEPVASGHDDRARHYRSCGPHRVTSPRSSGPRRSTAARSASTSGCR